MTSDSFNALMNANRSFVEQFKLGDLAIRPNMSTMILTCLDARVDPAHIFGLELGDAFVMRNAGGRVTSGVMGDIGILGVLGGSMSGPPRQPELVILRHTDCGMARLTNLEMQQQVAERLGISAPEVAAMAIIDPATSVHEDIALLCQTPGIPDRLIVSGFVYDVSNGTIEQIVAPAPLRAGV
ncbi:MAG: carbonic anhydrase [Dehalococcoidia bacterium]